MFDILNVGRRFELLQEIANMSRRGAVSIAFWSREVWRKAWGLEDAYWRSVYVLLVV